MQIIRTIAWVLLALMLLVFSFNNWEPVEIKIWENLVLETKKPALVIIAFLAGLLPIWLLYTSMRWRLNRRIKSLETAIRSTVGGVAVPQQGAVSKHGAVPEERPVPEQVVDVPPANEKTTPIQQPKEVQ